VDTANLDRLISSVVIVVALGVVALAFKREASRPAGSTPGLRFEVIGDWESVRRSVKWLDSAGVVEVVQFGDFECPYCRRFAESVEGMSDSVRRLVREGFLAFPLPSHPEARPAALEFLCSASSEARTVHDVLFEAQDSLRSIGARSILASRGLGTSSAHRECVGGNAAAAAVDSNLALGRQLGVRATPTVIVGKWVLSQPPTTAELERIIRAVVAGRDPARMVRE